MAFAKTIPLGPNPGSATYTIDLPLPMPPSTLAAGRAHQRAIVPVNTAADLATLMAGGVIPLGTMNPPIAVTLQVEAASGANPVFYTADGLTVAAAGNGSLQVPIAPATVRVPCRSLLAGFGASGATISLFSVGGANVACFYEWERENL